MAIKKNIAFIFLLFYPVIIFAQDFNIGVRVNSFRNFHQEYYDDRLNMPDDEQDWKIREFSGDVLFEYVRPNNIFYRIRVGYQKSFVSNNVMSYSGFSGMSRFTDRKESGTGYRFGIGTGKLYEFEKLAVKVGIELFLDIGNKWNKDYTYEYFDTNGKTKTDKIYTDEPGENSGGISVFSGVYYNFWKSFTVGLEVTNYFQYSQQKGTIKITYDDYDGNGNLISSDIENDKIDEKDFSTSFLIPSIVLYYRF